MSTARHGRRRTYRPDTEAGAAEEAGVRRSLAEGRLTLAPRVDGWVEVFAEGAELVEAPVLGPDGQQVCVWDGEGLSRWMREEEVPAPLLKRLWRGLGSLQP